MYKIFIILFLLPLYVLSQIEQPKSDSVLIYKGFSLEYSEKHRQAKWSAYSFTKNQSLNKFNRISYFHIENRVKNKSTDSDYLNSFYDRGHLTPIEDFRYDYDAMINTNIYSNICPQNPSFNRGIWKKLENTVRELVLIYDTLYIVSGPILNDTLNKIGNVSIPNYFYKIIVTLNESGYNSIAFLIPNEKSILNLSNYYVTIDYIESLTKIDFFYKLDDLIENKIESKNTLILNM